MKPILKQASIINIISNVLLFIVKFVIGIMFSSISLLSDSINSFSDVIAAVFVYFSVKINGKAPDEEHQFGHTRAENIAGYTTGVLMIILSLTIIKISVEKIIFNETISYNILMLFAVYLTFFVKLFLYFYIKHILKKENSPALKANLQDHLNDIVIICGVFVAILMLKFGYPIVDAIMGILIALFVFKSGFDICKENICYLMGMSANKEFVEKIKNEAMKTNIIKGVNEIKTQYLGSKIQVEIHIELDSSLTLKKAHDIGCYVKNKIEKIHEIGNCFVHIDASED